MDRAHRLAAAGGRPPDLLAPLFLRPTDGRPWPAWRGRPRRQGRQVVDPQGHGLRPCHQHGLAPIASARRRLSRRYGSRGHARRRPTDGRRMGLHHHQPGRRLHPRRRRVDGHRDGMGQPRTHTGREGRPRTGGSQRAHLAHLPAPRRRPAALRRHHHHRRRLLLPRLLRRALRHGQERMGRLSLRTVLHLPGGPARPPARRYGPLALRRRQCRLGLLLLPDCPRCAHRLPPGQRHRHPQEARHGALCGHGWRFPLLGGRCSALPRRLGLQWLHLHLRRR